MMQLTACLLCLLVPLSSDTFFSFFGFSNVWLNAIAVGDKGEDIEDEKGDEVGLSNLG